MSCFQIMVLCLVPLIGSTSQIERFTFSTKLIRAERGNCHTFMVTHRFIRVQTIKPTMVICPFHRFFNAQHLISQCLLCLKEFHYFKSYARINLIGVQLFQKKMGKCPFRKKKKKKNPAFYLFFQTNQGNTHLLKFDFLKTSPLYPLITCNNVIH